MRFGGFVLATLGVLTAACLSTPSLAAGSSRTNVTGTKQLGPAGPHSTTVGSGLASGKNASSNAASTGNLDTKGPMDSGRHGGNGARH
jgi:hypothetical protein